MPARAKGTLFSQILMSFSHPLRELLLSLLCIGSAFCIYRTLSPANALTVTIFREGKSIAVLVENPHGKTMLVDTLGGASILRDLGTTLPEWQRTIGLVVLSDVSSATAGAAPLVLSRYHVANLLRSRATGSLSLERSVSEALDTTPSTALLFAQSGERVPLAQGEYLDVLWPPETKTPLSDSDGALALRLTYGEATILFEESLTPRMRAVLDTRMAPLKAPTLRISSSTPSGVYTLFPTGVLSSIK